MTNFENYLKEKGISVDEVDKFFAGLNIEWDKTVPEGEVFFDLYPLTLRYNHQEKSCENYLGVDKYDFTLYRELEYPQKKNIDLSNKWIAFRLKRNPKLFDEYKNDLQKELEKAKEVRIATQEKIKEEYSLKRANLDKQYISDMEASNFATERLSKILKVVQEAKSENEQNL